MARTLFNDCSSYLICTAVRERQLSVILKPLGNEPWPILIVVRDRKATRVPWHDSGRLSSDSNREFLGIQFRRATNLGILQTILF
jgi:hypothetical protein